jgi:hypothetical protein
VISDPKLRKLTDMKSIPLELRELVLDYKTKYPLIPTRNFDVKYL